MQYITAGLCLLFLCPSLLWAYRRGLKDGLAIQRGGEPEPINGPVKAIQDHKRAKIDQEQAKADKETQAKLQQGLTNLFAYSGVPQDKEAE